MKGFSRWYAFVYRATLQQIRGRYVDTLLGPLWIVLFPLVLILIYTTIFSHVLHARLAISDQPMAYSIFLCAGLIPWIYFSDLLSRLTGLFTNNAHLLRKTPIPWWVLAAVAVLVTLVDYFIFMLLYLIFLIVIDHVPPFSLWLDWLLLSALLTLLTLALGVFLAILQVFFRDAGHFVGIALQLGFWMTPIVYPLQVVPQWAQQLITLNPMTPLVNGFQSIFLQQHAPAWGALQGVVVIAVVLLLLAWRLLYKRGGELVDAL